MSNFKLTKSVSAAWPLAQVRAGGVQLCFVVLGALAATSVSAQTSPQSALKQLGRAATPAEVKAWDIDVRPDFKGLPAGQGSVQKGENVWESKCASCHGSFGESTEIFTPIAGGTTAQDIQSGRVASLLPGANQPNRTTLMKVSTVSTLWDYINRAMPWNAPKSLTTDEVYAVTAYILNLGNIVPADYVLSDKNIREVQGRMPNRNGMTTAHAMWPGNEFDGTKKPDTQGSNCMSNCKDEAVITSFLPDYARTAHGNLADQSRLVGAMRGAVTLDEPVAVPVVAKTGAAPVAAAAAPTAASPAKPAPAAAPAAAAVTTAMVMPVLQKNTCVACHGMTNKLIGPSFADVAKKYKGKPDAVAYLTGKIKSGGQGVWGPIPMPAQALSAAEAGQVAQWLAQGSVP